jgi:acyl-CoA synthetase (AMP-forming)/AMP-acid ligase II
VRLRSSLRHAARTRYLRPGGAWDVPTLDGLAGAGPQPSGPALADSSSRLDAGSVGSAVAALAGGLRARGVRRGDAVAWQLPNRVEAVLLFRACWRIGAVAVPIHHQVGPADVAGMLAAAEPLVVLAGPGSPIEGRPRAIRVGPQSPDWEALMRGAAVHDGTARGADVAVALFTSGSTGEPKAVLHTHRGLAYKARSMAAAHGLGPADAVLMPAPLAHISGLLSGVLLPAAVGMRTVLMERWDAERANLIVPDHRISFMIGPPVYFSGMAGAANFSTAAMSSLRIISCGSMTIAPEFVDATRRAFGATVKRTYGSTEAPTVTTSAWDDPPDRARDTDGHVVGEAELRVIDPLTGRPSGAGTPGQLELRGPELFAGYADPAQTRAAMHGSWFRTGDLATVDDDGWLTIVGRTRDIIIRGGENIVPAEIERVLETHPAVRQAVVVGYPDDLLGERVAACVVATEPFGLEACRSWCAQAGIARFKTPERVRRLDALPTLSLGKPDRGALRAHCASGPSDP